MDAFVYTPRSSKVCAPPNSNQRRFTGLNQKPWLTPSTKSTFTSEMIWVTRFVDRNVAKVSIDLDTPNTSCSVKVNLTAAELRELAQRLLDAAHDIDTNPVPQTEAKSGMAVV